MSGPFRPLKRTRSIYDFQDEAGEAESSSRPRSLLSTPVLPRASSSQPFRTPLPPSSLSVSSTPFFTPSWSTPQDSPTNPFGLKRSILALDLPKSLSFSKHLALRFQLQVNEPIVSNGKGKRGSARRNSVVGKRAQRGGTYRVVQVPTNYTFRHLNKLIMYLFADDYDSIPSVASSLRQGADKGKGSAVKKKQSISADSDHDLVKSTDSWHGHYFTVLKHASLYPTAVKPGVLIMPAQSTASPSSAASPVTIDSTLDSSENEKCKGKSGDTKSEKKTKIVAKLSSVRERRLFKGLNSPAPSRTLSFDEESDPFAEPSISKIGAEGAELGVEDDGEDWHWEAEDDFTLAHVWPKGPTLDRGIIYHHTANITIHITANTLEVPPRKGSGNTPFVFLAQGSAFPHICMADFIAESSSSTAMSKGGPSLPEESELPITERIDDWNAPRSFEKFLQREASREKALRRPSPPPMSASKRFPSSASTSPERFGSIPVASSPPREPEQEHLTGSSGGRSERMIPSSDDLPDIGDLETGQERPIPSSPATPYSTCPSHHSDISMHSHHSQTSSYAEAESLIFPHALSAITPFPVHAGMRFRVERAAKRVARLSLRLGEEEEQLEEARRKVEKEDEEKKRKQEQDDDERRKSKDQMGDRDQKGGMEVDDDGQEEDENESQRGGNMWAGRGGFGRYHAGHVSYRGEPITKRRKVLIADEEEDAEGDNEFDHATREREVSIGDLNWNIFGDEESEI